VVQWIIHWTTSEVRMVEPIVRDSVVDALERRLRDDILSGRYPAGAYLPPERDLAAGYGVTRTSLKHAFVRLEQAGLVETRHGVGTRVKDYERLGGADLLPLLVLSDWAAWADEIFHVRRTIGAVIAALAAGHATEEHRAHIRALLEEVRGAQDAAAAQLAECEMHRVLAAATGNRVYVFLANSLLNAYLPVMDFLQAPFADPVAAAERLAPLVEAVCLGDPAAAHAAADSYLAETERLMLGRVEGERL
jgi:GntR family transcriptional regulator, transcriptional repressor for pyruvate dehydrogenase complex